MTIKLKSTRNLRFASYKVRISKALKKIPLTKLKESRGHQVELIHQHSIVIRSTCKAGHTIPVSITFNRATWMHSIAEVRILGGGGEWKDYVHE
jgi:hypothetical protein